MRILLGVQQKIGTSINRWLPMWLHIRKVTEKFKTPHVIHKFKTDPYVWFSDSSSIAFYHDLHTDRFFVWCCPTMEWDKWHSSVWWMKKRVAKNWSGCPKKKWLLFRTFCIQNTNPGDCEYLHTRLMFPDGVHQFFIWIDVDWLPTSENERKSCSKLDLDANISVLLLTVLYLFPQIRSNRGETL